MSHGSLSGEPNSASASAPGQLGLAHAGGPRNRNEPTGRSGWPSPARPARTASATASTASSWPTIRRCSSSSSASSRSRSPRVSSAHRDAGAPRHDCGDVLGGDPRLLAQATVPRRASSQLAGEHHRALVVLGIDGHVAGPAQLLDLRGRGRVLRAEPGAGGRAVDEVDRLVGQEAVGDVAVGQLGRRMQRRVGDRTPWCVS
jgi:hypothetical protein